MNRVLEVTGLSKAFGRLHAVDNVSFELARGGITGLIGPNGAGKTTLFNLVAGTLRPDKGIIAFDGREVQKTGPHRRFRSGLARTFQIPRPFPGMTVLENLLLVPGDQTGEQFWNGWFRSGAIRLEEGRNVDRARDVLEFTTLAPLANALAGTLSGGQQKLLELARVLMADPKLILLDEPAAGVNPALTEILLEKIKGLNARGVSFLIIEHNIDVVMSLCQPVIVMAQGRIVRIGTPEDVRNDRSVVEAYLGGTP